MSKTLETDEQFISAAAKHLVQQVLCSLQEEEEEQEDMDQQATKSDQLKTQSSPECFSPSKPSVPDKRLDNKETSTSEVEPSPLKLTPYGDQDVVDVKASEVAPIPTTQTSQLVSSTTSILTIEDVASVEEPPFPPTTPPRLPVPVFSFIQPLAEFLIGPTIEVSEMLFPLKSDSELAPGGRTYAQIRGSGVGATSPGSPHQCVTLLEPVSPTSDSTWLVNDNLITNEFKDFQSVTKVPIQNNGAPSLDTITAVSGVQRPTKTPSQITLDEQIPTAYGNSAFEVENLTGKRQKTSYLDDINKKLEPFTQTLPTYTPSRVYLRTINHNFEPDSIGMVYATADYRERYASTHRVLNAGNPSVQNEVPRLILPATPREPRNPRKPVEELFSPCPICPRYLCRPLKNVTSTRQSRPLRKQYSLSWWQPLNSTDPPRFTLPEPNAKLVRQLIQEQTAREKRLTDAIALAHQEAQSRKSAKFRKIRQRAQITSDRRSKVLVKGSTKEMMPLNTNGNQKSFCAHSVRVSGMQIVPPTDEPQQAFQHNTK
ncbi:hypothetical protein FGIG_09193 [Fasciola gigantica]|uniref:Uncharacterized protein n=1 Tax=Fasciola gigantica TaxID=46835 RepID=A0A504YVV0_FASGI|nr:hypothetical protein FGIG_09193 [Fasciola gigantica]